MCTRSAVATLGGQQHCPHQRPEEIKGSLPPSPWDPPPPFPERDYQAAPRWPALPLPKVGGLLHFSQLIALAQTFTGRH